MARRRLVLEGPAAAAVERLAKAAGVSPTELVRRALRREDEAQRVEGRLRQRDEAVAAREAAAEEKASRAAAVEEAWRAGSGAEGGRPSQAGKLHPPGFGPMARSHRTVKESAFPLRAENQLHYPRENLAGRAFPSSEEIEDISPPPLSAAEADVPDPLEAVESEDVGPGPAVEVSAPSSAGKFVTVTAVVNGHPVDLLVPESAVEALRGSGQPDNDAGGGEVDG